jgi:hypothetical protein
MNEKLQSGSGKCMVSPFAFLLCEEHLLDSLINTTVTSDLGKAQPSFSTYIFILSTLLKRASTYIRQ